MFSSHLIPWKPSTDSAICASWNTMKNSTRLSKPNIVAETAFSAPAPTQLWKPYQTMAGTARTSPGNRVPEKPNALRACTMNGMPYL